MAINKRSRDEGPSSDQPVKKQKRGFTVGPANLPDGTWKRKTQQIKKDLIQKAKIRKEYAKVKARQPDLQPTSHYATADDPVDNAAPQSEPVPEPSVERHPDRTQMIQDTPEELPTDPQADADQSFRQRRQRKPKVVPFAREHAQAQQRKEEAEERRRAREEAEKQRQQKLEERERFRRAMAKARTGGKNGQRKLGRESKVLLERVKRIVSES